MVADHFSLIIITKEWVLRAPLSFAAGVQNGYCDSVLPAWRDTEKLSKVLGWIEHNYTPWNECLVGGRNMHAYALWPTTWWRHDIMKMKFLEISQNSMRAGMINCESTLPGLTFLLDRTFGKMILLRLKSSISARFCKLNHCWSLFQRSSVFLVSKIFCIYGQGSVWSSLRKI